MTQTRQHMLALLSVALLLMCGHALIADDSAVTSKSGTPDFQKEVLPILQQRCLRCHQGAKAKGGLRLTSHANLLQGGDSGAAISVEKLGDSLLIEAINYSGLEMPPQGKISDAEIAVLTRWVAAKAPWPAEHEIEEAADEPSHLIPPAVTDEARKFWSFQVPQRPAVPENLKNAATLNPIDAFLRAKQDKEGLTPNVAASKAVLLRRLSYDLTGLPPAPEEVSAFTTDESPDAYERLVDRLLASPRYGEHWGRFWLDLVRFAETNSYERDTDKPNAWRYRDYVIRSLNEDKPYDQFVLEQLAGDELEPLTTDGLIATGYYRLGIWDDEAADQEQALFDELDDIVSTTAQTFLGLTIQCARCHDHKLDPLPQKDYYRFLAFFSGVHRFGGPPHPVGSNPAFSRNVSRYAQRPLMVDPEHIAQNEALNAHREKVADVQHQISMAEIEFFKKLSNGEKDDFKHPTNRLLILEKHVPENISAEDFEKYKKLAQEHKKLQKNPPPQMETALSVTEHGKTAPDTFVLIRGNAHAQGELVTPGFPLVLGAEEPQIAPPAENDSSGRRLALARWIASKENPLTARVIVNRIWRRHFGRGIVETTSNFGFQGSKPTHPELLDWLATDFMAQGWRLKQLHRKIVTSAAYRMESTATPKAIQRDPDNLWLARFNMRRLAAEEIRDSVLAVNGSLNLKMGGPSFYSKLSPQVLAGQSRPGHGWEVSSPEEQRRRAIYLFTKRSLIDPQIGVFDGPDTDFSCPERFTTTQPTQALAMINGAFAIEQASAFAELTQKQAGEEARAQVAIVLSRALQRTPSQAEIDRGEQFVRRAVEKGASNAEALRRYCLIVLNMNEFVYVD